MSKKTIWIIAIAAVVLIFAGWIWSSYNGLVTASEAVDSQWAQVETQYQRRFDLIPNLVAAVKGSMTQEQSVFGDIATARSSYANATTVNGKAEAASEVESSLSRLIAIVENYPDLKSSDNVQTLMAQLEGTENRINVERERYNDEVKSYNVAIKRFPTNLVASMFNYQEKAYFLVTTPEAANAPKVDLDLSK